MTSEDIAKIASVVSGENGGVGQQHSEQDVVNAEKEPRVSI